MNEVQGFLRKLMQNMEKPNRCKQRGIITNELNGLAFTTKNFHYPKSLNISCYFIIITINKEGVKEGWMVEKIIFFAIIAISLLVSGCDVYQTLYAQQNQADAEKISEEDIAILDDWAALDNESENIGEAITEEVDIDVAEDVESKELAEDANVVIVQETDLVSLVPKAEDPDQDLLTFSFTSPLDDKGEWQTNYGDAGEYTATVTASDGQLTASKEVLIIVKRNEQAPALESSEPQEKAITIDEAGAIEFKAKASDLNNDVLRYLWKIDGVEVSDKDSMEYKTSYEDAGSHTVKVIVSDGISDTEKIWSVTVNNVNRKPQLASIGSIEVMETDTIKLSAEGWDDDGDTLTYLIDDSRFAQDSNAFTWATTYEDAGSHTATISVSDGADTVIQQVKITVENVNRAPVILDIAQK